MKRFSDAVPRLLCLTLCLLLSLGAFPLTASAETEAFPSTEEAKAVYFYHIESGSVIGGKNEALRIAAGSTGKIIAGLIACEDLESRQNEQIAITSDMLANVSGNRLYLSSGDVWSAQSLLYAAICGSYNDAFDVLACYLSGSVTDFVNRMNQRAKELGANETLYTDCSGIADTSYTSAADTALIALAASKNTLYMKICSTVRYQLPETLKMESKTIYNRNALIASNTTALYYNEKCHGMNSGYTDRGGYCVVTLAQSDNESYLCVVMGCAEDKESKKEYSYIVANRLIEWVYKTYTYLPLITPETEVCSIPVTVSDLTAVIPLRTDESFFYYLPVGTEVGKEVTYSIRLTYTSLEAPVREGMPVGYVAIVYQGEILGTVRLYTAGTAERSSFVSSLKAIQSLTADRRVRAGLIFFTAIMTAWITTETLILRHRRKKWDKYFSKKLEAPSALAKKKQNKP